MNFVQVSTCACQASGILGRNGNTKENKRRNKNKSCGLSAAALNNNRCTNHKITRVKVQVSIKESVLKKEKRLPKKKAAGNDYNLRRD